LHSLDLITCGSRGELPAESIPPVSCCFRPAKDKFVTITRLGSNPKLAAGWDAAFGGKKAGKKEAAAEKSGGKKASAKKAPAKKAKGSK
jgi:hypothetical protein